MYGELYQYLILYKQLHMPGIGTFALEKKSADFDVAAQVIHPPSYTIALHADHTTPAKNFFSWLSIKLDITERDAIIRFNDFLFDLKKQLSSGNKLQWSGIGTLCKTLAGDIRLENGMNNYSPASDVPASKVLRQDAEHMIRVGEQQKTSVEMKELLTHTDTVEERKSWLWITAIVLTVLAVLFIGYYFSVKGLTVSAASNQQQLVPAGAGK